MYLLVAVYAGLPTGTHNHVIVFLRAHDIVAGIDKHDFPGNGTRQVAAQEERGVANIALLDIAAQGSRRLNVSAKGGEAGDAARGQRIERPG
jgi:hypothetical protein